MKSSILGVLAIAITMTGCATTEQQIYDYGNYSESFYALKRNPGEVTAVEWKTSLESIIESSNAQALRVPPGVFANLGYLYLKSNNNKKAIYYFEEEKKHYPEAEVFMSNLIKKAEIKG